MLEYNFAFRAAAFNVTEQAEQRTISKYQLPFWAKRGEVICIRYLEPVSYKSVRTASKAYTSSCDQRSPPDYSTAHNARI